MTYRTHLIIGRDICHWRTLLYHDVSNASEHWQWYLSLANFTISRRIERTWSLAGISVTDKLYYIMTYRTHLIIGRDICHWRNLLYEDVSNTPDHWHGYLSLTTFTISRRIEHTWSLVGISVADEFYYNKTYRTHLIIGRDICHWRTLLYQVVSNTPESLAGISVTDELYYIKTYRTHLNHWRGYLNIGRDICHWRTLLYQDVSNTPDHWQGYLSLTNFTISRRIEHTWSLAGISVTDKLYYIKTYRTHLNHWRGYMSLTNFTI